ncbi:hypothetical protein [Acinetobacter lwoffii]|nr:hypothetical protein [Acinetobacter lwoffii]
MQLKPQAVFKPFLNSVTSKQRTIFFLNPLLAIKNEVAGLNLSQYFMDS